jgi:hypothetical protein
LDFGQPSSRRLLAVSILLVNSPNGLICWDQGRGAENPGTALGLLVLLIPSLFLAPSFTLLILSVHYYAPDDKKIWSHAAVIFATVYTVMVSINYVQLTRVVPHLGRGEIESVRPFLFTPFDSFIYSVDVLG